MDNITTKIHKIQEMMDSQGDKFPFPKAPIYCIRPEIISAIEDKQFEGAYSSILQAGYGNLLPWPEIIVEFEFSNDVVDTPEGVAMGIIADNEHWLGKNKKLHIAATCYMKMNADVDNLEASKSISISSIYTFKIDKGIAGFKEAKTVTAITEFPVNISAVPNNEGKVQLQIEGKKRLPTRYDAEVSAMLDDYDVQVSRKAHYLALTILNTSGITREVVEPTRLNVARAKSGKPPIPKHHVVRIAHVYKRDGSTIKYVKGQKIHLRAGHTRQQAYGPNWSLHKPIFILPILVNYKPDAIAPKDIKL